MPRSITGNYTLPLPPVVPNTVISSAWANTTMDDVAQAITNSLDRYGSGGMVAPFRLADGTEALPAFAFSAETGSGLWREGTGVVSMSILGTTVQSWTANGINVFGSAVIGPDGIDVTGDSGFSGSLGVTGDVVIGGALVVAGVPIPPPPVGGYVPIAGGTMTGQLAINTGFGLPLLLTNLFQFGGNNAALRIDGDGAIKGHIGQLPGAGGLQFNAGAKPIGGGNWQLDATVTTSAMIQMHGGNIVFYNNDTLPAGGSFAPTPRMYLNSAGRLAVGNNLNAVSPNLLTVSLGDAGVGNPYFSAFHDSGGGVFTPHGGIRLGWATVNLGPTWRVLHGGDNNNAGFMLSVLAANVETQVMRAWQTTNVTFGTAASDYGGKLGVVPNTTPGSAADAKQISVGEASGNVLYRMQLGYAFFAAQHRGTISVYGGGIIAALHINEGGGAIFTPGGGGVGAVETGYEGYLYYNSIEVGWKDLGAIVEYKRGQCCVLFGNFTIPSMAQNALVSVYNEAGGPITLTPTGGLTLRLGGTALTGARTLANKGLVSVWYRTPTEAIIQGSGLT